MKKAPDQTIQRPRFSAIAGCAPSHRTTLPYGPLAASTGPDWSDVKSAGCAATSRRTPQEPKTIRNAAAPSAT